MTLYDFLYDLSKSMTIYDFIWLVWPGMDPGKEIILKVSAWNICIIILWYFIYSLRIKYSLLIVGLNTDRGL